MSEVLTLGFSPCPNDTFVFDALVHGRIPTNGVRVVTRLEDVETLNLLARREALDVTKVSYGVVPYISDRYTLLRSGGALGHGCGPLLVARHPLSRTDLRAARILIPGEDTTANLLLRLWDPQLPAGEPAPYSEIMPAVARGDADAGLIIHESRFTYPEHALRKLVDLGAWWEEETGFPIPLGGIVARRALGEEVLDAVDGAIRRSVEHALAHPADSEAFVATHAREMDPEVARRHIDLYVNEFSVDVGDDGERAVVELFRRARRAGLIAEIPTGVVRGGASSAPGVSG